MSFHGFLSYKRELVMAHLSTNPLSLLGDEYVAAQQIPSSPELDVQDAAKILNSQGEGNGVVVMEVGNITPSEFQEKKIVPSFSSAIVADATAKAPSNVHAANGSDNVDERSQPLVLGRDVSSAGHLTPGSLVPDRAQAGLPAQLYPPALAGIKLSEGGKVAVSSIAQGRDSPTRGRRDVNFSSSQGSPVRIMARGRSLSTNRRQGVKFATMRYVRPAC